MMDVVDSEGPVLAPMQWVMGTLSYDDLDKTSVDGIIGTIEDIQEVNSRVNDAIEGIPKIDMDKWTIWPPSGKGHCGDYAVTKRHELLKLGWPSSALLLAHVTTAFGEGHAVLVVRLPTGDVVLDNKVTVLRAPKRTGYKWVAIQNSTNPLLWQEVKQSAGTR